MLSVDPSWQQVERLQMPSKYATEKKRKRVVKKKKKTKKSNVSFLV
jgi:hypothetical protein